jgi:hypothetical protein
MYLLIAYSALVVGGLLYCLIHDHFVALHCDHVPVVVPEEAKRGVVVNRFGQGPK